MTMQPGIPGRKPTGVVKLLRGTVTSTGPLLVRIHGAATDVPVTSLGGYTPVIDDDVVILAGLNRQLFILGAGTSDGGDSPTGFDWTTTAGGDNMRANEPSGVDSPATDVTASGGASSKSIAIGQRVTLEQVYETLGIGDLITIAGTTGDAEQIVALGGQITIAAIPGQTTHTECIYVIAHNPIVGVLFAGIAIGEGPVITYITKPDDTVVNFGDTAGTGTYHSDTRFANDLIALGNGAAACSNSDAIAIGDGAVAIGDQELIAIGSGATAGVWAYGSVILSPNEKRFRRALPDHDCVAIGDDAEATGFYAIAIGTSAYAGRRGHHGGGAYPGDWHNYKPMSHNIAIGDGAHAGVYNADLDVVGTDNNVALGPSAVASHGHATAIGAGATTTAADQVMLGTAADTVVLPGSSEAVTQSPGDNSTKIATTAYVDAVVGSSASIEIADSGGVVAAAATTVEFTGTAVTSVTDDGGGHATVTIDQGTGGGGAPPRIVIAANINCPGVTYPIATVDVFDDDTDTSVNWKTLCITTVPIVLAPGDEFSAAVQLGAYTGSGTPTIGYAELDVYNMDGTESMSLYASTASAPSFPGSHTLHFDTLQNQVGTDLSQDSDTGIQSAVGGVFMAMLSIECYVTP